MNKLSHKVLILLHDLLIITILTIIATGIIVGFATIIYMKFSNV
jgi:hypothetical protein